MHSFVINCLERSNNVFVVLNTVLPEKRYFQRLKQSRNIKNAPISVHKTDKGLPFYTLDVLKEKSGINWSLTAEKCGRYASRIVAPHSVSLPDNSGLKRFIPISMNSVLVFNTALKIISASGLPADKICITVTDRNAVMPSRICELLPFASEIRIITSRPENYASAVTDAYANHGASLVLRNKYEPAKSPEIIVCCDGAVMSSMNEAAIFTTKRNFGGKIRFCGNGVELSVQHQNIIPEDIETVDFAGALTELCGSSEYRYSPFSEIEISCRNCENPTAEKCLECYVCNQTVIKE